MSGTENLFRRFLSIFSGKMATTAIALVSTPIIVRLLGPARFGDYAVLLSIFSMYMIPISAGITEGVQKFVSEHREQSHWQAHVFQFYVVLASATVVFGAMLLLGFTAMGFPERIFGGGFNGYFLLLVVFVLVSQYRAVTYHTVLGFGRESISESLNVVKKLVTVVLGIGLVALGYGVTGMLAGHIAANLLVAAGAGVVVIRRLSIRNLLKRPATFPYRELLSFNLLNILLVLLVMSLFHVDIIMLRMLTDGEATGFYKAALAIAEFVWVVPVAIQVLLLHSSSTLWSEDRRAEITALATRVTRYSLLFVLLLGIGLATLAGRVLPLYYGEPFAAAALPLVLLIPGVIGFAVARPLLAICQGSGRLRTLIVAVGGAAVLNLLLNGLLIPRFGMQGAAIATSIAYASMLGFVGWAALRIGFNPFDDARIGRIALTVGISAPIIVALDRSLGPDVLALLIVPPVGAIVFAAIAIASGAMDLDEILTLLGRVPGPVGSAADAGQSWLDRRET